LIRLLFISTGLGVGGAEISLLNLVQNLDRDRFEPHVVSLTDRGPIGTRLAGLGVPVVALDLARRPLAGVVDLVRLLRRVKPDVVQTWMYHADLLGGVFARLAGAPRVAWGVRNGELRAGVDRRSTIVVARLCAWLSAFIPRAIVSCSHTARDIHRALGYRSQRFVVIANGFDLSQFKPDASAADALRAELGLPRESAIVLHVARLHPHKNHHGLLRAAAMVRRQRPDVHFVLVGEGVANDTVALTEMITAQGLQAGVHRLGLRADAARLMAASDVLVLCSTTEAFPRVLGEALACGTPCVSTDVGDARDIVGECGRIVPPGRDEALAAALLELLGLPAPQRQELSQRARARAEASLDIRRVAREYEALYLSLAEEAPCAA